EEQQELPRAPDGPGKGGRRPGRAPPPGTAEQVAAPGALLPRVAAVDHAGASTEGAVARPRRSSHSAAAFAGGSPAMSISPFSSRSASVLSRAETPLSTVATPGPCRFKDAALITGTTFSAGCRPRSSRRTTRRLASIAGSEVNRR